MLGLSEWDIPLISGLISRIDSITSMGTYILSNDQLVTRDELVLLKNIIFDQRFSIGDIVYIKDKNIVSHIIEIEHNRTSCYKAITEVGDYMISSNYHNELEQRYDELFNISYYINRNEFKPSIGDSYFECCGVGDPWYSKIICKVANRVIDSIFYRTPEAAYLSKTINYDIIKRLI